MLNLNDREWKAFFISDICDIESGRDIYDAERVEGDIPYITSTAANNGIKYYVSNTNETLEENAISVNRNGSVGYSFYHKYKALYSNDCRKLKLKQCRNEFVALFITNQITQQKDKYNYGYKMGTGRLKRQRIMLPITDDGQPDYAFMEQYIREREEKLKRKYFDFVENISKIGGGVVPSLENKAWKPFVIGDLFDSYTGTDLIISKITEGEIPVISHAATNNGIACYSAVIERRPIFSHNNTISLADRGNFKAFVQKTDFYIGTRVKALVSKNVLSKEVLIFIANSIDKQAVKFSYGYNATDNIDKLHIMLPTTDDGQPDYKYMEQYIKAVMFGKYKKYLEYNKCTAL